MIIGSLAGALSAAGGFCAGSDEVVEHQRLSAASYTFSAALPAMAAVTASEAISMLQTQSDMITSLRDNIKVMWSQLDPKSEWMYCSSAPENPIMLMVMKPEVVQARRLSREEEQNILQDIADEVKSFKSISFAVTDVFTVPHSRRPYYEIKDLVTKPFWQQDGNILTATSPQSLPNQRIVEEGDREERSNHQARY